MYWLPFADASSTQDLQQAGAAAVPKHRSSLAVTTAAINFVDLAGSERAAHSADTGEAEKLRAKEVGLLLTVRHAPALVWLTMCT
jgi:hypothetical protein